MKWIDLTLPIRDRMEVYPGDPDVSVEVVRTREEHTWELRRLVLGSHTGTHADAPSHMHERGATLDELPPERFCGLSRRVTPNGDWPSGRGLFFAESVGRDAFASLAALNPPFVGGELSEELERRLLECGILTFTGLDRLERIPLGEDFMFFGFPLRIEGGDGSPVRAVAALGEWVGGHGQGETEATRS